MEARRLPGDVFWRQGHDAVLGDLLPLFLPARRVVRSAVGHDHPIVPLAPHEGLGVSYLHPLPGGRCRGLPGRALFALFGGLLAEDAAAGHEGGRE